MVGIFQPEQLLEFSAGVFTGHDIQKALDFHGGFHGDFKGGFQGFGENRVNRKFDQEKGPVIIRSEYRFRGSVLSQTRTWYVARLSGSSRT
jgi:hypothetical protein